MKNPAISIIIPIYNVEKWLKRAVETLQAQTFVDYELFLVNDGSTDSSGSICDELAQGDPRIKVIHRVNGGAASARNEAMRVATGDYLYFMDGDDWCEPAMLADMYSFAVSNDLELVVTGFYIDTYYGEGKFYREQRNAPNEIYLSQQSFREASWRLFDAQLLYAPWNKLYKRSYLVEKNIFFPKTFWDDLPFNLEVVRDVERVGCIDGHYYHFLRARAESENTKYRPNMYSKREEEHEWLKNLYSYWQVETLESQEFLSRRYAERLIGCIENLTNKNCTLSAKEKRENIERMISTPQAREALEKAQAKTLMMRVMLMPLKWKAVGLTMLECRLISWVKRNNTHLFAHLKASR